MTDNMHVVRLWTGCL